MAITYNSKIVRDGLVLHLDAANPKSYPRTGTLWTDITGRGNNSELINGPSFSSNNAGFLTFDGSNDYASVTVPSLTSYSLSFWLYIISLPASGERQIFGAPSDIVSISLLYSLGWKWHSWNGSSRLGNAVSTGIWYNFILTRTGSTTNFYVNNQLSNTFANGSNLSAGTGYFGDVAPGGSRYLNARFGQISFYNKVLSASEIDQNFEAHRSRYGI